MATPEEFDDYVRARWAGLVRSAALLTGDRASAEDLVQETLARTAQHWHRIEGSPDAYVRRVLHTRAIDAWRWRRRQPDPVDVFTRRTDQAPASSDPATTVAARITLADALRRLTPKQRSVLVLRFYEDRTEAETAAALGCSVNTVKSQTRHALDRLRALAPELAAAFGHEEALR